MQDRGKLDVSINRRRNMARNSFNSFNSSQDSHSNQFINTQNTHTERQSAVMQTMEQTTPHKNHQKQLVSNKELKQREVVENNGKNSDRKHNKLDVIREQNINLKAQSPQKRKSKASSIEPVHNHPQKKPQVVMKNTSSVEQEKQKQKDSHFSIGQEKKIENITKNQQKLSSNINDLKVNYQQLEKEQNQVKKRRQRRNEQSPFGVKLSPAKEKQIQQFLQNKQKQKQARHKLLADIALKQQHKRKLQQRELQMLRQRQKKRRLKQLKKYSRFDQKHQQWKQGYQQKQQMAEQLIKRYEGQVGYHIRAKKIDQQAEIKRIKQQEDILRQRRQYHKPLDYSQFVQHQRWHDDKLDQLNFQKVQQREEEQQRIADQNTKNNELWRGPSHAFVQEQLMEMRKKKRQPKDRARRIKQYKQYIKKNFSPKTYQYQSLDPPQIKERISNSHRQVRRYRFYKGSAVGEIKQDIPVPKTDHQIRKLGDNYLQYVKTLPKKVQDLQQEEYQLAPQDLQLLDRKFNGVGRVKRSGPSMYDDGRKKKALQITKGIKRDQLQMIVLQLQATDQRLRNKQILLNQKVYGSLNNVQGEQKSINQGFVENIDRKLTLLAQI